MSKALVLDDIEGSLSEVLSYFTLAELAEIRRASPNLREACEHRKAYIHSLLTKGALVEIVDLTSERGKQLNGRLAAVSGPIDNGRYPVKVRHITGKAENISLKPTNINPFLKPDEEAKEKSRLAFIDYSSDAKVREGHGRFFDQVLMLMRYAVNERQGCDCFEGEFEEFMLLPRADRMIAKLNREVFTYYKAKPSLAGLMVPGNMSVLDSTIHSLCECEDDIIGWFGKMAGYEKDGAGGELMVRNFVRFMQSWDKERVCGEFWLCKVVKTGTLVVQKVDDGLGNVYLVKGVGSVVGGHVPTSLPVLVRTTFLPLYDMLVYDEIMLGLRFHASHSFKEKIERHVAKAVREQSVIHCGESASRGLWNTEPPKVVKPVPSKKSPLEDQKENVDPKETTYKPTRNQLRLAVKLVKFAKRHGFKTEERPGISRLTVRRLGYTKEDNPMQMVGLMYQKGSFHDGICPFPFEKWPCYTLDELLAMIFTKVKMLGTMPGMLWVDETSLVAPLRKCLKVASDHIGFHEEVQVVWYPPPSDEEQAYHSYGLY
ncbi:hypothetical protein ACHAXT_008464 [Thalassiosira profunda]